MLPQTLRLFARQSATTTARLSSSSPAFVLPAASTISHRSYSQQHTSQASPLTPPDHLNDPERLGYNADKGTGDASLKRIDAIMGALVVIGLGVAGWAYFRSSSLKAQKQALGAGTKMEPKRV